MSGLARICKAYGGLKATANGKTVEWAWDYAKDKAVHKEEMPVGSKRWMASEKAKWNSLRDKFGMKGRK